MLDQLDQSKQIMMVSLEDLIPKDHIYRKFIKIWDFSGIKKILKKAESPLTR